MDVTRTCQRAGCRPTSPVSCPGGDGRDGVYTGGVETRSADRPKGSSVPTRATPRWLSYFRLCLNSADCEVVASCPAQRETSCENSTRAAYLSPRGTTGPEERGGDKEARLGRRISPGTDDTEEMIPITAAAYIR